MDRLASGEARWELVFDEDGNPEQFDEEVFFREVRDSGVEDLFVVSHGWNNDARAARDLYDDLFPLIAAACRDVPTLGRVGFVGVLWPSVWFPETPAFVRPPGGSAQADDEALVRDETSGSAALTGAEIAASVEEGFAKEADREAVRLIGSLIDQGVASTEGADDLSEAEQEKLIRDIHDLARSLAPGDDDVAEEDSGEMALFHDVAPKAAYLGLATTFGTTPPGDDTEGLGDWFRKALEGSKDMVRVLSYSVMKHRAGTVGRRGLGRLLTRFPARAAGVRVHLVGHSFGARLVSFALSGIDDAAASPVGSLLLIQGAFSHFAFSHAAQNPYGKDGALHQFTDRVHGPLVATFSTHDYAVGRWYPKASFLSNEDTEGHEPVSRWGGIGADGFQAAKHFEALSLAEDGGPALELSPGNIYGVDASDVINDHRQSAFSGAHSDIRKVPVARLAAAAAGAHT